MFDRRTGELRADDLELVIGPHLTRADFAAHPDFARFEVFVPGAPESHPSYRATVQLAGEPFVVVLWFEDERLVRLTLVSPQSEFGTSWADTTPDKDQDHMEYLRGWLRAQLGRPRLLRGHRFDWGEADVIFHAQDGFGRISVTYVS